MNLTFAQLIKQNRNFRNLLWGQTISELGSWFNFIAAIGLVRFVSDGSPIAAGLLLFWRTLPLALLMPFAGAVADRYSRRNILLVSDVLRGCFALIFLLVSKPEDLWIAYAASVLVSVGSAFFEGAKNAAAPNIIGDEGLLAGTALLFSSRFLLMAVGSALGGIAILYLSYEVAFIVNSVSFFLSAIAVWLIPADAMREKTPAERVAEYLEGKRTTFFEDMKEGIRYTIENPFALTILLMNVIWAGGGGATLIVFEGLSVSVLSNETTTADFVFAALMTANGIGLTVGMFISRKVEEFVTRKKIRRLFMGWSLILHGILFAIGGFMPSLWLVIIFILMSRVLIASEYAVQETMFQRSLPDRIRGRISTLDRGAEITVYSIASFIAGVALTLITAQMATAFAGLIAGCSGIVWLIRSGKSEQYGVFPAKKTSYDKT